MFVAVALMCYSLDIRDCEMMINQKVFITEEACLEVRDAAIGTTGPAGLIVGAACFKIPGEEA